MRQTADYSRLAEARGSLEHDLALKAASVEPAGRSLSDRVLDLGTYQWRARGCPPSGSGSRTWLGLGLGSVVRVRVRVG
eukprot:scaffold19751_cov63-Phaeocystis_antarctica.AAC.1